MKRTTTFDPTEPLIIVEGKVFGPHGDKELWLVVDTGSSETLVRPTIMAALGYRREDATIVTGVYSAVGKEQGYLVRVPRFEALGAAVDDFSIHVFDLADRYPIDGLIGLSFLKLFHIELRFDVGEIIAERIESRQN